MNVLSWQQTVGLMRRWHGHLGPLLLLPLLNSALTGVTYRLAKDWLGLEQAQVHWLMVLHEGEWLGVPGKSLYVLSEAVGVMWLLGTGSVLAWNRLKTTAMGTKGKEIR
ncbi:hypothetical protein BV61_05180 [Candidatus Synechococcus spongiarum LMB bulk15M]|uniref:Peptidase n=2 Tax=Candidatus Synechococcus spongiarum TaxID=431041 RepID=A0A1T1CRA4_9SYNE|nr:hypothetical protein BV61_05180 [Candidatus Synechococcus spongiarum LMB bulk15M]